MHMVYKLPKKDSRREAHAKRLRKEIITARKGSKTFTSCVWRGVRKQTTSTAMRTVRERLNLRNSVAESEGSIHYNHIIRNWDAEQFRNSKYTGSTYGPEPVYQNWNDTGLALASYDFHCCSNQTNEIEVVAHVDRVRSYDEDFESLSVLFYSFSDQQVLGTIFVRKKVS